MLPTLKERKSPLLGAKKPPSASPAGPSDDTPTSSASAKRGASESKGFSWSRFLDYVRRTVTIPTDGELDILRKRDFYILCASSLTALTISIIPLVILGLWDFLLYRLIMGLFPFSSIVWLTKRKTINVPLTMWTIMWSSSVFYATMRYSFQQGAIMVALTMMMGPTVGLFGGGYKVGVVHFGITLSCVVSAAVLNQNGVIGNQVDHGSPELKFSYFMAGTSSVMVIFVGVSFYAQLRREKALLVQGMLNQQADFAAYLLQEVRSSSYTLNEALRKIPGTYSREITVAAKKLEELRESLQVMADAAKNDQIFQHVETKQPIGVVVIEKDRVMMQSLAQTVWSLGMALTRADALSAVGATDLSNADIIMLNAADGFVGRPKGTRDDAWVIVIGGASGEANKNNDKRLILLSVGILPNDMRALLADVSQEIAATRRLTEEKSESEKILSAHKLGSTWELGEIMGRGGNGTVYKAHDSLTGGTAAVKVVSVGDGKLEIVLREIRVMCSIEHPDIVHYFFCQRDDPIFYLFMELCDSSLQSVLDHNGPLSEDKARWVTKKLVQALAYIHKKGITHGDVKPGNILLKDGQPKLSDFGTSGWQSVAGKLQGTLAYLDPQSLNGHSTGQAADIWATGCFAAVCLGCPPKHMLNRGYLTIMNNPSSETDFRVELPEDQLSPNALSFILSCLQLDVKNRPTAEELLKHTWLEETTSVTVRGISPPRRPGQPVAAKAAAAGGGGGDGAAKKPVLGVGAGGVAPSGYFRAPNSANTLQTPLKPDSGVSEPVGGGGGGDHGGSTSVGAAGLPHKSPFDFDSASTLNSNASANSAASLQSV